MKQDNLVTQCDRIDTAPEKKMLKKCSRECGFQNFKVNMTIREIEIAQK